MHASNGVAGPELHMDHDAGARDWEAIETGTTICMAAIDDRLETRVIDLGAPPKKHAMVQQLACDSQLLCAE